MIVGNQYVKMLTSVYLPRIATRELLIAISELLAGQLGFGTTVGSALVTALEVWIPACEVKGRGVADPDPKVPVLVAVAPMAAVVVMGEVVVVGTTTDGVSVSSAMDDIMGNHK